MAPLSQEALERLIIAFTSRDIGLEMATTVNASAAIVPVNAPVAGSALTFDGTNYIWTPNDLDPLSLHLNGGNSPTANINWGGFKIANLGAPTLSGDAVTKDYVDVAADTKANKFLSNLTSPTAINQHLLFGADGTLDIGSLDSGMTLVRPGRVYIQSRLLVNASAPIVHLATINDVIAVQGTSSTSLSQIRVTHFGDAAGVGALMSVTHARGTFAAPTALLSQDLIGTYNFNGYKGDAYRNTALITAFAGENWSSTAAGTNVDIRSVPNGTIGLITRFRVAAAGHVAINSTLGIGAIFIGGVSPPAPNYQVDLRTTSTSALMQWSNTATANTAADGLLIGIDSVGNAIINQQESLPITLRTGANATQLVLNADGTINASGQIKVASLGVGNSAAASIPGTVTKKIEVFDASGTSLGFLPVYDAIT